MQDFYSLNGIFSIHYPEDPEWYCTPCDTYEQDKCSCDQDKSLDISKDAPF